jgi:hypothetical protein
MYVRWSGYISNRELKTALIKHRETHKSTVYAPELLEFSSTITSI